MGCGEIVTVKLIGDRPWKTIPPNLLCCLLSLRSTCLHEFSDCMCPPMACGAARTVTGWIESIWIFFRFFRAGQTTRVSHVALFYWPLSKAANARSENQVQMLIMTPASKSQFLQIRSTQRTHVSETSSKEFETGVFLGGRFCFCPSFIDSAPSMV